ncbi:hypothetical protein HOLleu_04771 [Holothuria leucospilota]|uniref:Uncharacterized protein n=1 Tax=Holothuria leucospilota TaxID=206669 RepID=A0A9Q1CIW1_HOLLE|nr:hypothetical protein HOLleu_04771 [Holothuria leucospilota]
MQTQRNMGLTLKRWRSHAVFEIALFLQLISFGEVTSLLASNYTNLVTSSVPLSCHEICDYDKLFGIADCEVSASQEFLNERVDDIKKEKEKQLEKEEEEKRKAEEERVSIVKILLFK